MNRQVPTQHYLLIGRGRLANHLAHFFDLKNISYLRWSRLDSAEDLDRFVLLAKKILLAISDDAIDSFIKKHHLPVEKTIHFSGALSTPMALQLHPLMTFSFELYDKHVYETMSFVSPASTPSLKELLPELDNPHYLIPEGSEALYHALCVLSGNGTTLLWQTVLTQFQQKFSIPSSALWPYLEQIVQNLQKNPTTALTGPWVRNDEKTIQRNEQALAGSSLLKIYHSLSENYQSRAKGVFHENRT